jgi:predicted ATPase
MINDSGFLKRISLSNFLSYGAEQTIDLKNLNVFIGPNTSGKSNFIEALRLLRSTSIKGTGGIQSILDEGDWIWQGESSESTAKIEAITDSYSEFPFKLRYALEFKEFKNHNLGISSEKIVRQKVDTLDYKDHQTDYIYQNGTSPSLVTYTYDKKTLKTELSSLEYAKIEAIDTKLSILSQLYDLERFPNISTIADSFKNIVIYRDLDVSADSKVRKFQKPDQWDAYLWEDASNLALIINNLHESTGTSNMLYEYLGKFSRFFDDIGFSIRRGDLQIFIREKWLKQPVSARRLSSGHIRFLCLLAILCNPEPPPITCIEEPELCMHPDIMGAIAELLIHASQRTQLFVTTHSDHLVSALTKYPESVIVCNKTKSGTNLKRYEKEQLEKWLEKYTLGDLWLMGEIGGVS